MNEGELDLEGKMLELIAARDVFELARAILHVFSGRPQPSAWSEVAWLSGMQFTDSFAFIAIEWQNGSRFWTIGSESPFTELKRLSETAWNKLAGSVRDPLWSMSAGSWSAGTGEKAFRYGMGKPLMSEGVVCGYILIGRHTLPYTPEERRKLALLVDYIGPICSARVKQDSLEELKRQAEAELRESRNRLISYSTSTSDMIYVTDLSDRILEINLAGLSILGLKEPAEVIGKSLSGFCLNSTDRAYLLKRLGEEGKVHDFEVVLRNVSGKAVFCIETTCYIRDQGGDPVEILGVVKDISERTEAQKELWKSNLSLADANAELKRTQSIMLQSEKLASIGQLAAGIAHEINNPLGFLKSNHSSYKAFVKECVRLWSLMLERFPDVAATMGNETDFGARLTEMAAIGAESDEGYDRIMKIIGGLKNFARQDAEMRKVPYDINAGVRSILILANNEIKYVAKVVTELGDVPIVDALGGGVNQVILNMLVNAAQAIGLAHRPAEDPGTITVRTGFAKGRVFLEVRDNGPGIPEEAVGKLFDPFFTTKEPGKGTGLGLSISYDIIVNKHGGTITAGNAPGGGALFRFELPAGGEAA